MQIMTNKMRTITNTTIIMEIKIKQYNAEQPIPKKENEIKFYIQNKGNYSGRPLKNPIPNCWEVVTERSTDFEILYIVFESRILEPFIGGSVIPYLRLSDYKKIIEPILKNAIHENRIINEHYLQIRKIEENLSNQEKVKSLMKELKKAVSREAFKKIKTSIPKL